MANETPALPGVRETRAEAWFVGSRIDVRELERSASVAATPLTVRAGRAGYAVVFRYGVVVAINLNASEVELLLSAVVPMVSGPFDTPETESLTIRLEPNEAERVDADGVLTLREFSFDRLQVVANILGKSAVLSYYEDRIAATFDQIERLAQQLRAGRGKGPSSSELMRQIADALMAQIQTVGRVEVTEKPEITWDYPELDRLYERLSIEYELRDRDIALTRKLDFISQTAQTYLDVLETRQGLRLEWYIVLLILVEIALTLYQLLLA